MVFSGKFDKEQAVTREDTKKTGKTSEIPPKFDWKRATESFFLLNRGSDKGRGGSEGDRFGNPEGDRLGNPEGFRLGNRFGKGPSQ